MKTSITSILLTMLILMANIVTAINDNEPDTNSKKVVSNDITSIMGILPDGNSLLNTLKPLNFTNSSLLDSSSLETIEKDYSYLRFNVENYMDETSIEDMELPVSEYKNLKFDVTQLEETNPKGLEELPDDSFNYLRFDINKFSNQENGSIDELPVAE
ncbi:MAG: hypothetical protein HXX13_05445 [Bacteroidetes bacterium]|nr:hypothetical protein [Bacteroidota bacterium]